MTSLSQRRELTDLLIIQKLLLVACWTVLNCWKILLSIYLEQHRCVFNRMQRFLADYHRKNTIPRLHRIGNGSTSLVDFLMPAWWRAGPKLIRFWWWLKCSEPSATSAECRGTSWCCLYRTTCKQVFKVPTNYAALFLSIYLIYFWANGAFLYLIYFFETQSC